MSDRDDSRPGWAVHKFGGTSLADAGRYRSAADRVVEDASAERRAVVVSAMAGVTDRLLGLLEAARRDDRTWSREMTELKAAHHRTVEELIPGAGPRDALCEVIERGAGELDHLLRTCTLVHDVPGPVRDLVSGIGEVWSAQLLAGHLAARGESVEWLDAREVLVVEDGELAPRVAWDVSAERLRQWLATRDARIVVVTGFVARTPSGVPTTLRRNGSDFTASIFGRLLEAASITIWTDVSGVMSADPRRVPDAFPLDRLSYDEAMELAYFGASVLHPQTMAPAIHGQIPIRIRNSRDVEAPGTRIGPARESGPTSAARAVRGLSTVDDLALINVEGTGMVGVPGIAARLFAALREIGVSVVMISQASSEHSICLAVPGPDAERARETVMRAFAAELEHGQVEEVSITAPCTLLAAVGDAMAATPGVASRLFRSLALARINVRAVAQGASERNISVVVDEADSSRALRAVHAGFYLSEQTISVGIVGTGVVGRELLKQLAVQLPRLNADLGIDIRVRGIARSRTMTLSEDRIDLQRWLEGPDGEGVPTDLETFAEALANDELPHRVMIDCTASADVAACYPDWIRHGFHVITPNKLANTAPLADVRHLRDAARRTRRHYLYEGTVGAGLPIINTLRDLITTGDRVHRVEGVLSGTLSSLFNTYDGSRPFSELLIEARDAGFTEPDPRDDLSGMDVARKLVILAREMGLDIELDDVAVESLVPDALADTAGVDAFLAGMPDHDATFAARLEAARSRGCKLRYVGRVDVDPEGQPRASVALVAVPDSDAFATLTGSDNLVAFTTDRYSTQPLIVRGPGAGPAVTAGGVFADLLRLASYLGAPS